MTDEQHSKVLRAIGMLGFTIVVGMALTGLSISVNVKAIADKMECRTR